MITPPDDDDYKVGPSNPPREHRWKKGEPSPNPRGRPSKKPQEKLMVQMNALHNAVLAHAAKNITVRSTDGVRTITQMEACLDLLLKMGAKNNAKAMQIYLNSIGEASAESAKYRTELLCTALEYRAKWLPLFEHAEAAGKELPNIYPDPRDIQILPDGTVKIVGPLDIRQWRAVQDILEELDKYQSVWSSVKDERKLSLEDRKQIWRKTTRAMRKLNSALPPRLKVFIPPQPKD